MTLLIALAARVYGAALRLYPRAFYHEFGGSMAEDFVELSHEVAEKNGTAGLAVQWILSTADLAISVVYQRIRLPETWMGLTAIGCAAVSLQAVLLMPMGALDVRVPAGTEEELLLFVMMLTALFPIVAVIVFAWWFLPPMMRRRPGRRRA